MTEKGPPSLEQLAGEFFSLWDCAALVNDVDRCRAVWDRMVPQMTFLCRSLLSKFGIAASQREDLAAECLSKLTILVFEGKATYRRDESFVSWFCGVMHNLARKTPGFNDRMPKRDLEVAETATILEPFRIPSRFRLGMVRDWQEEPIASSDWDVIQRWKPQHRLVVLLNPFFVWLKLNAKQQRLLLDHVWLESPSGVGQQETCERLIGISADDVRELSSQEIGECLGLTAGQVNDIRRRYCLTRNQMARPALRPPRELQVDLPCVEELLRRIDWLNESPAGGRHVDE